jgi:hypothetical protein
LVSNPDGIHGLVKARRGWRYGDFDRARLWVPRRWEVLLPNVGTCPNVHGMLLLGGAQLLSGKSECGGDRRSGPVVRLRTLRAVPGHARVLHVDGYRILSPRSEPAGTRIYDVPALQVAITMTGAVRSGVLASLGPSPQGIVSTPGPATPVPSGWHQVSYRGVQADVPGAWPTVSGVHAGFCGYPFTDPTVYVGPANGDDAPSCPVQGGEGPPADGLWLQVGRSYPTRTTVVRTPSGQRIRVEASSSGPILTFWYHGEFVQLGIGRDPLVERAILDSVKYRAGAPNTPVAGTCPSTVEKAMPAPTRLATRRFLEQRTVKLDPPRSGDRPTMTARRAWQKAGTKEPGASYELILARYSSKFPARVVGGKDKPIYQHVLAWVVYAVPTITPEGPCGGFGLSVFNARTGKSLGTSGYYPGP